MKRLKIRLLFSVCIVLFIIFVIRLVTFRSSVDTSSTISEGRIIEIDKTNEKTNITILGKEKILIIYYGDFSCKYGDYIRAYGNYITPSSNKVFYLFNYRKYLLSKNIFYSFKTDRINVVKHNHSFRYKVKNYIYNRIKSYKSSSYIKAFILGNTKEIDEEVYLSYRINGIIHLFAISGVHIGILCSVLLFVLNKILSDKYYSYFIVIMVLFFYLFLTGFPASFLRATLLFTMIHLNKVFNLNIKPIYLLIIIFLLLLCFNPFYYYDLGFLLSFTVSFFLILFGKFSIHFNNKISKSLYISLVAFFSSIPLLINSNFSVNFLSPFLSLIFGPIITVVLFPCVLLSLFLKPLDVFVYNMFAFVEKISILINKLEIFNISFGYMNIVFIILYYTFLSFVLYSYLRGKKYFICIFIFLLVFYNINYLNFNNQITFIDVGQGDSSLIKYNNNKGSVLIDTGGIVDYNGKKYNLSDKTIIPYLKAEGVKTINYLILTHGDFDHMGEAINLANNFKVEKVVFNCGEFNDLEKELIKVLDKKKIKYYSCIKELKLDNNKLYFLQTKEYDNENDNSNVIYTQIDGYKFMFMGDASSVTEKEILNKYNISDIDVLKVGHHGSRTSSSIEFINKISPKYSIISVGKNNRYGHPNKEVLDNLKDSKIYRTDVGGSIKLKIRNNKLKIDACSL